MPKCPPIPPATCPPPCDASSQRRLAEVGVDDAPDVTDPRVAAMLPAELLQPGELIILLTKPSPLFIVLEPLRTLAIIAMLTILAWAMVAHDWLPASQRDVVLGGVAVAGLRIFWQFLEWLSRVYVLTDRRIIRVRGVLRVHVFECSLKRIQHTAASYSLIERLFGLGTIGFATAGTGQIEAWWRMLANPLEVHQLIVKTLNRYR